MKEFILFLKDRLWSELLAPAIKEETIDFVSLERIKDDYLTSHCIKQAQTASFGPLPLLAFLNAKEIESKNLRTACRRKKNFISRRKNQRKDETSLWRIKSV
jgi:V/A-type H+-transporting ATPase subunit C